MAVWSSPGVRPRDGRLLARFLLATLAVLSVVTSAPAQDTVRTARRPIRLRLADRGNGVTWTDGEVGTVRWRGRLRGDPEIRVETSSDLGSSWHLAGTALVSTGSFSAPTAAGAGVRLIRVASWDGKPLSNRVRVRVAPRMVDMAFGVEFVLSLHSDGTLRGWGLFPSGMMEPTTGAWTGPTAVTGIGGIRSIAAGGNHALLIRDDGTVLVWGDVDAAYGTPTRFPVPTRVEGISGASFARAYYRTSFVRLDDGRVFAWGGNLAGNLGDGTDTPRELPTEIPALHGVLDLQLGRFAGAALMPDGTVLSWGWNGSGQGGDGTYEDSFVPRPVLGVRRAVAVAMRGQYALALDADGAVWAWGDNRLSELGRPWFEGASPVPQIVPGLPPIAAIGANYDTAHALSLTGDVFSWGANSGRYGDGTDGLGSHVPRVADVTSVVALHTGLGSVHVLDVYGRRFAWGNNWAGSVGDGTWTARPSPRRIYAR